MNDDGIVMDTPSYIARQLDLATLLQKKSNFYDLLDAGTYLTLSREPGRLAQEITEAGELVVVRAARARLPT
jgi:hypothetical protein